MAIQTRRGNYADFVPENLLEGEFATVLDRKYVFVGMPNGQTVQLGTLEAIQEVLAQAEEFKEDSEAYAVGKRDGADVPSTDPTYQNNSKYYAQLAQGYMQSATYIFIRYSAYADGTDFTIVPTSTTKYMGVYQGSSSTAPSQKEGYYWSQIKGEQGEQGVQGETGVGISSISKTSTSGLVDTYTITLTNGSTSTFEVTNGFSPIAHVTKSGSVATFTVTDAHGTTEVEIRDGQDGQGSGDMLKSTYDKNNNGIVDEAEKWANATSIGNGLRVVNGVLEATAQAISNLDDIGDVEITNVSNGQVLGYDSATDKWKNVNAGAGGGGSTIKITTSEPALYSQTVTLTNGTTTLTGTFSASGEVTFSNVMMTGNLTATCQTATVQFSVPYYGNYTFELATFTADITVTYPSSIGATCTCSNGTTTLTANASPYTFNVHSTGTWTITTTVDGVSKVNDVVITTDGQTESVTVQFGTINVTVESGFVGSTITCSSGGVSMSKTATLTSVVFYPPTIGTWTISGSVSGSPYSVDATVTDLTVAVSVSLITVPDGSTVLPTDDIQTWLQCGGIFDKTTYTTLSDVLSDSTTLSALIADHNAVGYMVRSKSWASNKGLVPQMTSNTTPSGEAFDNGHYSDKQPYLAFDGNTSTQWEGTIASNQNIIGYEFTSPKVVRKVSITNGPNSQYAVANFKVQGYDGSNWTDIATLTNDTTASATNTYNINNDTPYEKVQLYITSTGGASDATVYELQFYSIASGNGITEDSTAMSYIGLNNYCANTLLADSDWATAINNSTYIESVLNLKVPIMTDNTHPSGVCSATSYASGNEPYKAFDGNDSTYWYAGTTQGLLQGIKCVIYDFGSNVKIYACHAHLTSYSDTNRTDTVKVLGSTTSTESDYVTLKEESLTVNGIASGAEIGTFKYLLSNVGNYRYYAYGGISQASTTPPFERIQTLQFYGRQDV